MRSRFSHAAVLCMLALACSMARANNPFPQPGDDAVAQTAAKQLSLLRVHVLNNEVEQYEKAYAALKELGKDALHALYDAFESEGNQWLRVLEFELATAIDPSCAIQFAKAAWNDPAREVQDILVDALCKERCVASLDLQVRMLEKSSGKVRADILGTLSRWTGQDLRGDVPGWVAWWKAQNGTFDFSAVVKETTYVPEAPNYHSLKVVGSNVIFLVDASLSMSIDSRFESACAELKKAINDLSPDTLFNVIFFAAEVAPWRKGLVLADDKNKKSAAKWVGKIELADGTNTHGALMEAFKSRDVDMIFLLSDGEPTAGVTVNMPQILRIVRERNRMQRVTINTIGCFSGKDEHLTREKRLEIIDFMKELATQNQGTFLELN